jgi:aspartyl-tRNA(Asn)/glutamyl-tRNA(Gln) amidotransferase subunit B
MTALMDELKTKYEVVIGLEVHAQLKTKSKIFAPTAQNSVWNKMNRLLLYHTWFARCLPVLNKEVLNMAILTGLALNCEIASYTKFDRKQYFYPDLPKGYQFRNMTNPLQ